MNNGRIWCVVSPTVGLPLFLGSVALISFTVHFAVLNNTTWVSDFFKGKSKGVAKADAATTAPVALKVESGTGLAIQVVSVPAGEPGKQVIITVTPQGAVRVVDDPPAQLASAASSGRP